MESSQTWREMKSVHDQVDLTLRLGFPNGNGNGNGDGGEPLPSDIDRNNKPSFPTSLHDINHHALQTHQVMVNYNNGMASSGGGRNGEMRSEANYNPHQIVWSKELKTYVLSSNYNYNYNYGQLHEMHNNGTGIGIGIGIGSSSANNMAANLHVQSKNNNELYTLLNPANSRMTADDHEAEPSSSGRRKASRRRRVSSDNIDVQKRCTNYNCNTNFTPMWRKGPLGPKSLCNACGIRYRKEMLNREAMAAENSNSHS